MLDLRGLASGSRDALLATAAELIGPGRLVYSSRGRHKQLAPPRDHLTAGDPSGAKP